tara:strand:+ start:443 stop:775 length:333 start_codon:yes stop_codon:yes gene_type:complete
MATKKTIEKLAECFPASMAEHLDIKKAMPEREALTLLHSGFIDCTYRHDECATYYLNKEWCSDGAPTIAVILDSNSLLYIVCNSFDQEIANFKNASKAIDFYTTKFMGSK